MHRSISASLAVSLLLCLAVAGCGSGGPGAIQPAAEEQGAQTMGTSKSAGIPPPGTLLEERVAQGAALLEGLSRSADTSLTLGGLGASAAPTNTSVPVGRINLLSTQVDSTANPIVWVMTPTPTGPKLTLGDNDLGIGYGTTVFAWSSHYGPWEEWVAFEPVFSYGVGRYYAYVWGAPDVYPSHAFRTQVTRAIPVPVNGTSKTGSEVVSGSDWFYFDPPYNPSTGTYDPVTVTVTALGGDDPDLFLYDMSWGQGSAPVAASYAAGSDSVSYTAPYGYRIYARVQAYASVAGPCDYMIRVTSP